MRVLVPAAGRRDALIWRCEALRGRVPPQGPFGRNRRRQGRWAGDAGLPGCPTPAPPRKRAVPAFHKPLESLAAPGRRPLTVNQLTEERMAAVSRDQPTSWRAVLSLVPLMRIVSMTRKYGRDVVPSAYKKSSIDRGCAHNADRRASRWPSTPFMTAAMPRAALSVAAGALESVGLRQPPRDAFASPARPQGLF
jgi:hypothetical protein